MSRTRVLAWASRERSKGGFTSARGHPKLAPMSDSSSPSVARIDDRPDDALRPITIETGVQAHPEGSVLYRCGGTAVLVSVSVADGAPPWMHTSGHGWLTAEYAMHPRANRRRQNREGRRGSIGGRTAEIQRLIGRSLRAAVALDRIGERTITVDCDVLDADGGTRTASVTGGYIGLAIALHKLREQKLIKTQVLRGPVAAISVGLLGERPLLDLCYEEDRDADVDLNVVATASGGLIEVQGTAEGAPIPRAHFDTMLDMGLGAMADMERHQRAALTAAGVELEALL